jgi:hypothetical protein
MKKILLFASLMGLPAVGFCVAQIWTSSHTATADTTKPLCISSTYIVGTSTNTSGGRGILHGVCVNDSGPAAGTVAIYNSSSTAVNPVAIIRSTSAVTSGCAFYDVQMSSGIVYTNSTAGNDVTILYECY